jgi:assimilatory nitrate reductase catalytic subunit
MSPRSIAIHPRPHPLPENERGPQHTRSTCPYCGVGCGVIIESQGDTITAVRGDPDHPANFGRLCTKGSTLALTAAPHLHSQRALQPLLRNSRGEALQATTWETALDTLSQRLAHTVAQHGPDAVGFYISGQLLTEDYYVFNKLAKGLIGTNNIDTNSRLCMSSAVAGYKASLGSDAVPGCYDDLALAHTVFITGSNMAWAHPVLYRRLEDARAANPAMKVVVADPRRTETAAEAHLHLQLLPGTDVVLHHALLHVMLWEGLVDHAFIEAHTTGFAALRDRVREFTPAHAAKTCGLRAEDIVQAARWFAGVPDSGGGRSSARTPTLSLWCQGLNQSSSGTDKNTTLINLHLATGQIGKPGAGPLSLTGQPNAMGGREVGGLANLLSAHRDLANPAHRAEVAALWGVPDVPSQPGKSAVKMFEAAAEGQIKLLWIACTNPAQSMPHQAMVKRALERAAFVVLQEAYGNTATVPYADLLLPTSSWGEKTGTVTNSERRISRVRPAVPAPGQARNDWQIAADVAQRLEKLLPTTHPQRRADGGTLFPYTSAEAVWNEHRESTRGRDLDITGLSYARLDQPQQWPCAEGGASTPADAPGAARSPKRLYTDHRFATPDGRARFTAPAWRPVAEPRDARHPMALTTGRLRDQWHGMSRTGTLGRLFAHTPEPHIALHPQELQRRHWTTGDLVQVTSRRGSLVLPVLADDGVAPAQACIAMHWGPEYLSGLGVNALTTEVACPQSEQPELKHTAVRVEKADLPWHIVAAAWLPAAAAPAARQQLRALFPELAFASCVAFGREPADCTGLLFRAAAEQPAPGVLAAVESALQLVAGPLLRYADARNGQHRALRLRDSGELQAFVLAGDTRAAAWVLPLLQLEQPAARFGRALLAASLHPPQPVQAASPQVCACHDVSEARILQALARCSDNPHQCLQQLQQQLHCATACGSCLPAVKALVKAARCTPTLSAPKTPGDTAGLHAARGA